MLKEQIEAIILINLNSINALEGLLRKIPPKIAHYEETRMKIQHYVEINAKYEAMLDILSGIREKNAAFNHTKEDL